MDDINEIRRRVEVARSWAQRHFNTNGSDALVDENLNLLPPKFSVEFTDIDKMVVRPMVLGMVSKAVAIEYRLKFKQNGSMVWQGKHPFYQSSLPELIVEE